MKHSVVPITASLIVLTACANLLEGDIDALHTQATAGAAGLGGVVETAGTDGSAGAGGVEGSGDPSGSGGAAGVPGVKGGSGSGGISLGGSAGAGGIFPGGSAGSGGVSLGGSAGSAGSAGAPHGGTAGNGGNPPQDGADGSTSPGMISTTSTSFTLTTHTAKDYGLSPIVGDISALGDGLNDSFVFMRDTQAIRYIRYDEGGWVGFSSVANLPGFDRAVVVLDAAATAYTFALDTNKQIHQFYYKSPPDSQYVDTSIGSNIAQSGPAVAITQGYQQHVFACGTNGSLLYLAPNTQDWVHLADGAAIVGAPAAVSDNGEDVHVFATFADHAVHHRCLSKGVWGDWETWGGAMSTPPAVASWAPNRLDVVARGLNGNLMYRARYEDGSMAPTWTDVNVAIDGVPGVATWGVTRLFVVGKTVEGELVSMLLVP